MSVSQLREIDLLIMDDDVFFNNLLAKKFDTFKNKPSITGKYNINISQFSDPDDCLAKVKGYNDAPVNKPTIAFVDYYLGNGINGQHLIKLLINQNKAIKIVLMSQSERVIGSSKTEDGETANYSRLIKREYTPEICCLMLLQFITYH